MNTPEWQIGKNKTELLKREIQKQIELVERRFRTLDSHASTRYFASCTDHMGNVLAWTEKGLRFGRSKSELKLLSKLENHTDGDIVVATCMLSCLEATLIARVRHAALELALSNLKHHLA